MCFSRRQGKKKTLSSIYSAILEAVYGRRICHELLTMVNTARERVNDSGCENLHAIQMPATCQVSAKLQPKQYPAIRISTLHSVRANPGF